MSHKCLLMNSGFKSNRSLCLTFLSTVCPQFSHVDVKVKKIRGKFQAKISKLPEVASSKYTNIYCNVLSVKRVPSLPL